MICFYGTAPISLKKCIDLNQKRGPSVLNRKINTFQRNKEILTSLINFVVAKNTSLPQIKTAMNMYRSTFKQRANNLIEMFTYIDFDSIRYLF